MKARFIYLKRTHNIVGKYSASSINAEIASLKLKHSARIKVIHLKASWDYHNRNISV